MAAGPRGKGVTWEELFFDLAFVFALTQFSRLLREDHGWGGLGLTLILFVPVYWSWGGVTLYANQHDVKTTLDRVGIIILGFVSLLLALTIPGAYGDRAKAFISIYLVGRVLLAVLAVRSHPVWRALFVGPYGVFLLTGPLLLAGAFMQGPARIALWAAAATIDLLSPWAAAHLVAQARVQPVHYAHRYGLLIILVLGESVISLGAVSVDDDLNLIRLTTIGAAYALVGALWWVYFGYGLPDFRQALEGAQDQPALRRAILVYSHLVFSFAIVTIAVGLADMERGPLLPLPAREAMLLFGGCALFVLTFAYTYWRIHRTIAWRRLAAVAACLVLAPSATRIPALTSVLLAVVVLAVLTAAEERVVRRQGGPAMGSAAEVRPSDEETDRGPATSDS